MTAYTTTGALTSVESLPKVSIVNPGTVNVWTNKVASGDLEPGMVVMPLSASGTKSFYDMNGRVAEASSAAIEDGHPRRFGVAMHQPVPGDIGLADDGPTELVNATIESGQFLRVVHGDATIATTRVEPTDDFVAGDMVTYDPGGDLPASYGSDTGCWTITTDKALALGEVEAFRAIGTDDGGLLYIRLY